MRISDWSSDVCSSDLALFHGGDVFARHHAALDGIDEFEALAGFVRLDLEHNVAVLTLTAGLANELAFAAFHRLADGFAVDRKSVVSGMRVSSSVSLGGCGLI